MSIITVAMCDTPAIWKGLAAFASSVLTFPLCAKSCSRITALGSRGTISNFLVCSTALSSCESAASTT